MKFRMLWDIRLRDTRCFFTGFLAHCDGMKSAGFKGSLVPPIEKFAIVEAIMPARSS
jgi:hypothetical protein